MALIESYINRISKAQNGGGQSGGQSGGQEQLMQKVAQALQQGANPKEIMQQLIQMGMSQEQAGTLIQVIMQQVQGGQQQASPIPRAQYGLRQQEKAARLFEKAERREKRTAEGKEIFAGAGPKWAGVEPIFGTGKYARIRAEKAMAKAEAGSRKAWKNTK